MKKIKENEQELFVEDIEEYFDSLDIDYLDITSDTNLMQNYLTAVVDLQEILQDIPKEFEEEVQKLTDNPGIILGIFLTIYNKTKNNVSVKSILSVLNDLSYKYDDELITYLENFVSVIYKVCLNKNWSYGLDEISNFINSISLGSYYFDWNDYKSFKTQEPDLVVVNLFLDKPLSEDTDYRIIQYSEKYQNWDEYDIYEFDDVVIEDAYLIFGNNIDKVDVDEINNIE